VQVNPQDLRREAETESPTNINEHHSFCFRVCFKVWTHGKANQGYGNSRVHAKTAGKQAKLNNIHMTMKVMKNMA
jgi:hypothetical protein